jgi:hypothetical protein
MTVFVRRSIFQAAIGSAVGNDPDPERDKPPQFEERKRSNIVDTSAPPGLLACVSLISAVRGTARPPVPSAVPCGAIGRMTRYQKSMRPPELPKIRKRKKGVGNPKKFRKWHL